MTRRPPEAPSYELVADQGRFDALVDELLSQPAVALDTEFHRERTYFPQLALLQLAWDVEPGGPSRIAVVDPLAVDVHGLAAVLESDALIVLHAADQDLQVLDLACGRGPSHLYDTQIAAGFLGLSTPSLGALHERVLGLHLPKGDRLTDWLRRPLDDAQLAYAASDVAHLLRIRDRQVEELTARGRLAWALDECEAVRARARGARAPEDAWTRVKEVRQLRGRALAIGQAVTAWREQRAAALDIPVRFVLPDLAIVAIAQRPPASLDALRSVRGLDGRFLKDGTGRELLAVVQDASGRAPTRAAAGPPELERELRPALGLVAAWLSQLAHNLEIDSATLATRGDLEALLRGDADGRLATGWRAELVGEPVRRLVQGEAALAFAPEGQLLLEERSYRPVGPDASLAP